MKIKIILLMGLLLSSFALAGCNSDTVTSNSKLSSETTQQYQEIIMPEPFGENQADTGGDELSLYYDGYDIRYRNIPGSLLDLVNQDDMTNWINSFESGERDKSEASIYTFLKEFNISKSSADEWLNNENSILIKNNVEPSLNSEDINVLYSNSQELIDKNFVSKLAIYHNKKIYTPEWLYTHTIADYKKEGLSASIISEKMSLYKNIPFTQEARTAFENKVKAYSEISADDVS